MLRASVTFKCTYLRPFPGKRLELSWSNVSSSKTEVHSLNTAFIASFA